MSRPIIEVQNVSKHYRLGAIGATSLREEFHRYMDRLRGRHPSDPQEFWALRDVSFEVQPGEVVGIIGRNGAGKSTLLKILSRITEPTSGRAILRGRVASLLEVGTGFHPELTGRDNIYLNGAILGMTRAEVRRKFDEIVAFAEVEKFIDTPVKRYSSGMYVRLAFAVAAHLEPEILIIDEVLAVGDADFQRKCLGRMSTVAGEGRTVLFVSHNMAAVSALCHRSVLLDRGQIALVGGTPEVIKRYLSPNSDNRFGTTLNDRPDRKGNQRVRFTDIAFLDSSLSPVRAARAGDDLVIALTFDRQANDGVSRFDFEIGIYNQLDQLVFLCGTDFTGAKMELLPGQGRLLCHIPKCPLPEGLYELNIYCGRPGEAVDWVTKAAQLDVAGGDFFGTGRLPPGVGGMILVSHRWEMVASPK